MVNRLQDNYTIVYNKILNNPDLSLKAKGLYAFLCSKPPSWKFSYDGLSAQLKEGKKAIRSAVKELVEAKVLIRVPIKDENNFWCGYEWIINPTEEDLKNHSDPFEINSPDSEISQNGSSEFGHTQKGHARNGNDISNIIKVNTEEVNTNNKSNNLVNNKNNNISSRKSKSSVSKLSSQSFQEALEVARYLYKRIKQDKPNFAKPPSIIEKWAVDIDKAIRIDKRSKTELLNCIDWIYETDAGNFWIPNILSGKKLRDKFDIMEAQMMRDSDAFKKKREDELLDKYLQELGGKYERQD